MDPADLFRNEAIRSLAISSAHWTSLQTLPRRNRGGYRGSRVLSLRLKFRVFQLLSLPVIVKMGSFSPGFSCGEKAQFLEFLVYRWD